MAYHLISNLFEIVLGVYFLLVQCTFPLTRQYCPPNAWLGNGAWLVSTDVGRILPSPPPPPPPPSLTSYSSSPSPSCHVTICSRMTKESVLKPATSPVCTGGPSATGWSSLQFIFSWAKQVFLLHILSLATTSIFTMIYAKQLFVINEWTNKTIKTVHSWVLNEWMNEWTNMYKWLSAFSFIHVLIHYEQMNI